VSCSLEDAMTCFDFSYIGSDCTLGVLTGMIWLTMTHS